MGVTLEDEAPRMAELHRVIQDFRNEFRESVKSMVRRDVYDAQQHTMQLQINNLTAQVAAVEKEREAYDNRARATKALAIGIAVPGTISFLIAIVDWLAR